MVVLAASVLTTDGKVLLSRQFVEILRSRIEGLLAAFPKLLGQGDHHTYIESEHVRYLFQKFPEDIIMVLITSKTSNIVEDLETLQLMVKLVPEFCGGSTEKHVIENAFELVFAMDHVVTLGMREKVTVTQIRTFVEMDSQEERIWEMNERNKEREAAEEMKRRMKEIERERREREKAGLPAFGGRGGSSMSSMGSMGSMGSMSSSGNYSEGNRSPISASVPRSQPAPQKQQRSGMKLGSKSSAPSSASFIQALEKEGEVTAVATTPGKSKDSAASAPPPAFREPVEVIVAEQIQVSFDREGALNQMIVQGELIVNVTSDAGLRNRLITINKSNLQYRVHPNINRDLFLEQGIITLADAQTAYRSNTPTSVLKWRYQTQDDREVPVSVFCWPSVSGDGKVLANIEYELSRGYELVDFLVSIPVVGKSAPAVTTTEGKYQFDSKNNVLRWQIPLLNGDNSKGRLDLEVAQWDNSGDTKWLFPIQVSFVGRTSFAKLHIEAAETLQGEPLGCQVTKELTVQKYVLGESM